MSTLLLVCAAPLQSWGLQGGSFAVKPTEAEPTLSGVVGLIANALGRDREDPIGDLAVLRMGVRVDQEGRLTPDYQTVAGGRADGGTVVSHRHYLADAVFLVGLEGADRLLDRCAEALAQPARPLFLGRRSCLPSRPLLPPDGGRRALDLEAALRAEPWSGLGDRPPALVRMLLPAAPSPSALRREDVPVSFAAGRREYRARYVRVLDVPPPAAA